LSKLIQITFPQTRHDLKRSLHTILSALMGLWEWAISSVWFWDWKSTIWEIFYRRCKLYLISSVGARAALHSYRD